MNYTRPGSLKAAERVLFLGNFEIAEGAERGVLKSIFHFHTLKSESVAL